MTLGSRFILGDGLGSEARAGVVRLMLIKVFLRCLTWSGLRQRPPWHVLLARGVRCVLGGVTAGTDGSGRARFVNKSAATTTTVTTVAEGIFGGLSQLRLALGVVLGARVLLQVVWLHPWFSANFRCAGALLPVQIGLDGVIKEESIFVKIVLGLLLSHPLGLREGLSGGITVLDLIVVHVLGAGGVLANVLLLGQLVDEDLGAIPAVSLREAELGGRLLNGQRQLAEGSVRLLAIKCLCQRR